MRSQQRWLRLRRGARALALVTAAGALATACNVLSSNQDATRSGDVFDKVRQLDLYPRQHHPADVGRTGTGEGPRSTSYFGTSTEVVAGAQRASSGEGYELN